jgi:hypothetical protein
MEPLRFEVTEEPTASTEGGGTPYTPELGIFMQSSVFTGI